MHRLDKLASGILVIAKTQDSFDNLKKQFQDRIVKKYYTALVYGRIDKDEDTINFPIERSAKGYKMAAKPRTVRGQVYQNGKRAITEFKVIKRYINYTLLEVRIKTGRTHQIRVHLSAYGYPVVGDDLYGTKKTKDKNKKLGLNRLYLVANKIEFNDLNRNSHSFSIEIPDNFKKFLTQIK